MRRRDYAIMAFCSASSLYPLTRHHHISQSQTIFIKCGAKENPVVPDTSSVVYDVVHYNPSNTPASVLHCIHKTVLTLVFGYVPHYYPEGGITI